MWSTMSCGCSSYASRARAKPANMSLACMNNVYQAAQGLLHHIIPLLLVPKPPCLFFALEWTARLTLSAILRPQACVLGAGSSLIPR